MKRTLLFYVPLCLPNGRPHFFRGALQRFVPYFAGAGRDFRLHYWGPQRFADLFQRYGFQCHALSEVKIHTAGLQLALYERRQGADDALIRSFRASIDFAPDVIVGWETPMDFMAQEGTTLLHLMPGPTSRAPFAERVIVDPFGLFKDSALMRLADEVEFAGELSDVLMARQAQAAMLSDRALQSVCPIEIFSSSYVARVPADCSACRSRTRHITSIDLSSVTSVSMM